MRRLIFIVFPCCALSCISVVFSQGRLPVVTPPPLNRNAVNFVVTGRLTGPTGSPISGALIRTAEPQPKTARTTGSGDYRLESSAPAGTIAICVQDVPRPYLPTCHVSPVQLRLSGTAAQVSLHQNLTVAAGVHLAMELEDPGHLVTGSLNTQRYSLRLFLIGPSGLRLPLKVEATAPEALRLGIDVPAGARVRIANLSDGIRLVVPGARTAVEPEILEVDVPLTVSELVVKRTVAER